MKAYSVLHERTTMDKNTLPTQENSEFWIRAENESMKYSESTKRCGKWMIFIHVSEIDDTWIKIRKAIEDEKLGRRAKVATMKENRNAVRKEYKVICVYTYDSDDREDVVRVLKALREIGIRDKMYYKEDEATVSGQYSFNSGGKSVSKYWVDVDEIILRIPKNRR